MPDEEKLKEVIGQAGEIIDKIKKLFDGFPYSTGKREELEPCIGKQEEPQRLKCRMRNKSRTFSAAFDYSRAWGFVGDSCTVDLTLFWTYDGCHLYDIHFTVKDSDDTSNWIITPKVSIDMLQQKEKSECVCCPKGGDVVLLKIEITVEYEAAFWPNPTMTEVLFEGTLNAVNGTLKRI